MVVVLCSVCHRCYTASDTDPVRATGAGRRCSRSNQRVSRPASRIRQPEARKTFLIPMVAAATPANPIDQVGRRDHRAHRPAYPARMESSMSVWLNVLALRLIRSHGETDEGTAGSSPQTDCEAAMNPTNRESAVSPEADQRCRGGAGRREWQATEPETTRPTTWLASTAARKASRHTGGGKRSPMRKVARTARSMHHRRQHGYRDRDKETLGGRLDSRWHTGDHRRHLQPHLGRGRSRAIPEVLIRLMRRKETRTDGRVDEVEQADLLAFPPS